MEIGVEAGGEERVDVAMRGILAKTVWGDVACPALERVSDSEKVR